MGDRRRRASRPVETVFASGPRPRSRQIVPGGRWRAAMAAAVLLFAPADPASACSCAPVDRQAQVPGVSVIFLGEVVGMPDPSDASDPIGARRASYRFRVIEVLKGSPGNPTTVTTAASPAACGVLFSPGTRYLIFAYERDGELQTTLCDFNESGPEADRVAAEVRRILAPLERDPSDP